MAQQQGQDALADATEAEDHEAARKGGVFLVGHYRRAAAGKGEAVRVHPGNVKAASAGVRRAVLIHVKDRDRRSRLDWRAYASEPARERPMRHKEQVGAPDAQKLRDLALWYREFAERAGSTTI